MYFTTNLLSIKHTYLKLLSEVNGTTAKVVNPSASGYPTKHTHFSDNNMAKVVNSSASGYPAKH